MYQKLIVSSRKHIGKVNPYINQANYAQLWIVKKTKTSSQHMFKKKNEQEWSIVLKINKLHQRKEIKETKEYFTIIFGNFGKCKKHCFNKSN